MKNRALLLAFFANIIQYYDYALFGLSASMLAEHFMPHHDISKNMLSFFAIMSFAVIMRPVGSFVFGYIGDTKGRASVLKISIFLASISTIVIGIIPASNDILSCSILILSRMIFMMSLAGEGDGVRIYVAETIGVKREFLGNGLVSGSSQIGVLIATLACFLSSSNIMPEYFWRINFIFGGVLGLILYCFRQYIGESAEFKKVNYSDRKLTKQNIPLLIYSTIINGFIGGIYHFQIIFLVSFLSTVTMILEQDLMREVSMIIVLLYIISAILSGYLADKYSPKKQIIISLLLTIMCTIFNAIEMAKGEINISLLIIATSLISFYSVPLQIMLKRKMPINNRLKLFSLSHSFGSLIFSSSSALIGSWIWHQTHLAFAPMIYMIIMTVILLICARMILFPRISC